MNNEKYNKMYHVLARELFTQDDIKKFTLACKDRLFNNSVSDEVAVGLENNNVKYLNELIKQGDECIAYIEKSHRDLWQLKAAVTAYKIALNFTNQSQETKL